MSNARPNFFDQTRHADYFSLALVWLWLVWLWRLAGSGWSGLALVWLCVNLPNADQPDQTKIGRPDQTKFGALVWLCGTGILDVPDLPPTGKTPDGVAGSPTSKFFWKFRVPEFFGFPNCGDFLLEKIFGFWIEGVI